MTRGDVGRRLLQGERESVQLAGELLRPRSFLSIGVLTAATSESL